MDYRKILITGGAGFVGSTLGLALKSAFPSAAVLALDNLQRRGSELNLPRLREGGVEFVQGDVRRQEDFDSLPAFDLLIDCAAEPSVQAGQKGSPAEVIHCNLVGTINALETARRHGAALLFLSTSRVYPMQVLNDLPFTEEDTRFRWRDAEVANGIDERFPLTGAKSFYGASKLACELLIEEYVHTCKMPALINRCGLLAGPWQMGKVDQGVICLWVARHHFSGPLQYIGFGGAGKQVRDVLHIQDLVDLVFRQLEKPSLWDGKVYHAAGGVDRSVSLLELTRLCESVTGTSLPIASVPQTSSVDVRILIMDSRRTETAFGWKPTRTVEHVVRDIRAWIEAHGMELRRILE